MQDSPNFDRLAETLVAIALRLAERKKSEEDSGADNRLLPSLDRGAG